MIGTNVLALESIIGGLRDLAKLQPETVRLGRELIEEIVLDSKRPDGEKDEDLQRAHYTADFAIYRVDEEVNKPKLRLLGRRDGNPLFSDLNNVCDQLLSGKNYKVSAEMLAQSSDQEDDEFDLTRLRLKRDNDEWMFLEVGTSKKEYDKLNVEERRLAERVYGMGEKFSASMAFLRSKDITTTRVYVLNPEYVKKHAGDGALGRACWLDILYSNSIFYALDRIIDIYYRLRGVRAEGAASEASMALEERGVAGNGDTVYTFDGMSEHLRTLEPSTENDKGVADVIKSGVDYLANRNA